MTSRALRPRVAPGRRAGPAPRGTRRAAWRRLRLRRWAAVVAATLACWLALGPYAVRGAPPTTPAVVSTADLPLGHVLRAGDVTATELPSSAVPESAMSRVEDVVGRPLTSAVGRGEVVTGPRVRAGGARLEAGRRAVHVPLTDAAATAQLHAGDHIDIVSVADGSTVVPDAVVVDVDRAEPGGLVGAQSPRGMTVAVPTDRVGAVTSAALGARGGVHVAIRSP